MKIQVQAVLTGRVANISDNFLSGIRNHETKMLVISKNAIEGDEVHNQKHHGGEMRVIHHFSEVHYQHFKNKFPEIADRFIPGSFGENLYTSELNEDDLCIGDIFSLGTARIQVTASRRPCATINLSYQDHRILKEVIRTGRTGWFYRILEEGVAQAGDYLELIERPYPHLPLGRLFHEGYNSQNSKDLTYLSACLETGLMDKGWDPAIKKLLK